jgi:hypothetical protein
LNFQLNLLESFTDCDAPSPPNLNQEEIGPKFTSLCFSCKQELPLENFHKNKSRTCGVARECKTCSSNYKKLKKQYVKPPNQICQCCKTKPATVFDHDHNTNEFRGWICKQCNLTIGFSEESIERLDDCKNYLNETTYRC